MMTTLDDLRRARQAQMDAKQDVLQSWPALLGRISDQLVPVAGRDGYVHVRIGSDETAGQARNKKVPNTYDLAVYVGYDGISPEFQVLGIRQEDWVGAGYAPIPEVGPHGATHTWPTEGDAAADGSDVTYVAWRQILSLRIGVTAAFTVEVGRGPLYRVGTGQWEWIATQNINLAADRPVAGARWALVYLDDSGVLQRRLGAIIVPSNALVFPDCPAPLSEEFPLAAVRLYATQTAITETRIVQDVIDLRFQASGGGGTTLPAYARGSLIYGDAADWAALVHPGAVYHLQTDATDVVWLQDVILDDGIGDSPQVQFIGGSNNDTASIYLDDDAVAGDSDLVIRLCAADTGSQLIIQDNTPATVAYIDADGNARFVGHMGVGVAAVGGAVVAARDFTTNLGGWYYGADIIYEIQTGGGAFTGRVHGFSGYAIYNSTQPGTSWFAVRGFVGGSQLINTGLVNGVYALEGINISNISATTACVIQTALTANAWVAGGTTATVTTQYMIYAFDPWGAGAWNITTLYGLYLEDMTAGAVNYAIYTGLGDVRFGDAVLIDGSGAADVQLTVQGAVAQAANLQEWESSAAAVLLSVSALGNLIVRDDGVIGVADGAGAGLVFDSTPAPDTITIRDANLVIEDAAWLGSGAATARLVFDSSGATDYAYFMSCNFGIGTAAPLQLYHQQGTSIGLDAAELVTVTDTVMVVEGTDAWIEMVGDDDGTWCDGFAFTELSGGALTGKWGFVRQTTGAGDGSFHISYGANANPWANVSRVIFSTAGTVTIPALGGAGNDDLYVDNNGTLINDPSDERFKENIEALDSADALTAILGLRGCYFDWGEAAKEVGALGTRRQVGLIAQEVEPYIPLAVTDVRGQYKSVSAKKLIPYLVEAIKAQQVQIEALKGAQ